MLLRTVWVAAERRGKRKMLAAESYKHFRFVGVTRLELATSRPPDAYSNQLSYTPYF